MRRAQILLKADADGPGWTDQQIADAFSCRTKTVENIRQRCVLEGFERALERQRRALPPGLKLLDGEQCSAVDSDDWPIVLLNLLLAAGHLRYQGDVEESFDGHFCPARAKSAA